MVDGGVTTVVVSFPELDANGTRFTYLWYSRIKTRKRDKFSESNPGEPWFVRQIFQAFCKSYCSTVLIVRPVYFIYCTGTHNCTFAVHAPSHSRIANCNITMTAPTRLPRPITPPGPAPLENLMSESKLSFGVVCSSNINRSMEAHLVLGNAGKYLRRNWYIWPFSLH